MNFFLPEWPDLPMVGIIKYDAWEKQDMFYPNKEYHERLLKFYGYEGDAGLYLDTGAIITPV